MSEFGKIKLTTSCILSVPFQIYENTFTFIVNGKEFKTSRIISDLISPEISRIHSIDPTVETFTINTSHQGDFTQILNLFNFQDNLISSVEVPFILEVIEKLGNDSIEYQESSDQEEITINNVFSYIKHHEKSEKFNSKRLSSEIDFISSHFYEVTEDKFKDISVEALYRILTNDHLQLNSEDQLLNFVNNLYKSDFKYSILYEAVLFENVSGKMMKEFTTIFNNDDMSKEIWIHLSKRLENEIEKENHEEKKRYRMEKQEKGKIFLPTSNGFDGIFRYLRKQSNEQIKNEVNFTASSVSGGEPQFVTIFEDQNKFFYTKREQNSWICFDFKNRRVIPTDYTIRSIQWDENNEHPRNWVIECSCDNNSWEIVDEQTNCSFLNGNGIVHTFKMSSPKTKEFQYIRMRNTGPNWQNDKDLDIESFEIYGRLI